MIYRKDVEFFLECFSTNLAEVADVWREKGGFIPITDLAEALIARKGYAPKAVAAMSKIAVRSFPVDFRSGAFERQNFFYGLADYYAETTKQPTALVEFDVGNCNGTGDYVGDDNLFKVIRYMRATFERTMLAHGAVFAQAFDNAKNDDLKLIVTGLTSQQLAVALQDAQQTIMKKFIFASDIPHSKYSNGDRNGIGVGSGFANLGKGRTPQALQERLNLFVEKRKLEDSQRRLEIRERTDTTSLTPDIVRGFLGFAFNNESCVLPTSKVDFPYDLGPVKDIADPFDAREAICDKVADEAGMTDVEKTAFSRILNFYHSSEALTGARRDNFLYEDMLWVQDHMGQPVTLLNVKVENCAGINKVLSHVHSAEMTKHFVEIVSDFTRRNFSDESANLVYYIGRNTFNIIVPGENEADVQAMFRQYLQEEVDLQINQKTCGEYFSSLGLDVPDQIRDMKVGHIPNLRGLTPGVLAINIHSKAANSFADEGQLIRFQNACISSQRGNISSSTLELPNNVTYHQLERGRTPQELLEILQKMARELIECDHAEEQDNQLQNVLTLAK